MARFCLLIVCFLFPAPPSTCMWSQPYLKLCKYSRDDFADLCNWLGTWFLEALILCKLHSGLCQRQDRNLLSQEVQKALCPWQAHRRYMQYMKAFSFLGYSEFKQPLSYSGASEYAKVIKNQTSYKGIGLFHSYLTFSLLFIRQWVRLTR